MPMRPPNDTLAGHQDYLQFVAMKVCLKRLHIEAESKKYDNFAKTVLGRIERECPFVLREK